MKKTVVAQSQEHRELREDGWKPISAYQAFEHKQNYNKDGDFLGHDLKEKSKLFVVMEKSDENQ